MILKRNLSWGLVVDEVKIQLLASVASALLAYYLFGRLGATWVTLSPTPLTIIGGGLSVFLAFRNNTAYDRWWEARTLWGGIVNRSRSLSRQTLSIFRGDDDGPSPLAHEILLREIAYVHALRAHLRGEDPVAEIRTRVGDKIADEAADTKNPPIAILLKIGGLVSDAVRRGECDTIQQSVIEDNLTGLTDLQGGCERIRNTPLPPQYDTFPRIIVYLFVYLLPLGLVEDLGLKTLFVAPFVAFLFLVLEAVGRDIEAPFANTIHDTPMTALSTMIEIEIRHAMGDGENAPNPIQPKRGYLM